MTDTRTAACKSYDTDKATAQVYRELRQDVLDALDAVPADDPMRAIRRDVLAQEAHRLHDLVREYEISAGQTAAQHPEVVR